jgi:hypothetical protein
MTKKVKVKRKRRTIANIESPTKDFRNVSQVAMGGGMVGMMTPLMSAPTPGNIGNAIQGSVGFAILGPMAGVGFDAIDRISASGKKKKKY